MPFLKIQTALPLEAIASSVEPLLAELSQKLAQHLGKPEAYVMTSFEPSFKMTFAGSFAPTCYLEVKSVGTMSPAQTQAMSRDFCTIVQRHLAIPPDRTYIEFNDAKGSMWGYNGTTF
ncbi:phenylpyruvate tautomerase MIF-related protein [Synechocystis sp. LKSZ1]|uniref:phenylpyruvate tautomerase MIF-related protein n=1 Tax=Synechocystis sp. LKSZ1 TaxID=3144951 RepID=UPI00336BFCF7